MPMPISNVQMGSFKGKKNSNVKILKVIKIKVVIKNSLWKVLIKNGIKSFPRKSHIQSQVTSQRKILGKKNQEWDGVGRRDV